MKVKKLYHFTLLVRDLEEAEDFYARVFAPHTFYRGYAPLPLHRTAALLNIADTVIEPMRPLAPEAGEKGTSIYRFLDRFGPGVHSLALLVSGAPELAQRFEGAGIRWTDGGMANHVFPHPRDFPGLLELADFGAELERFPLADPRMTPGFTGDYWRVTHPLGIVRTSHYTVVVHDCDKAARHYVDLLDARRLPEQPAVAPGCRAAYVAFPDGAVVELAEPVDGSGPLGAHLEERGEAWYGVTFRVADLHRARAHLLAAGAALDLDGSDQITLDTARTFGVGHAFTTRDLDGDPRLRR